MAGQNVRVLVGTKKGAFIYSADQGRERWTVSDPILPGWSIYHMSIDTRRDRPRMFAAGAHWAWGPFVGHSDDLGKTWDTRSPGLGFAQDPTAAFSGKLGSVWQVTPGHASQPDVLFAGTQPAGLFRSDDGGESWSPVAGINEHPYREAWGPSGGGDSALHSIAIDPRDANHLYASISTGGTYESIDGGDTWSIFSHRIIPTTEMAKRMEAEFAERFPELAAAAEEMFQLPENVDPAASDEFHKMRIDPKNPDRLWGQAHTGVYRIDNVDGAPGGWQDVTEGLPSFHGFPLAVTHHDPDGVFVVPLVFEQDNFRTCGGQLTVYRTGDGGSSWEPLTSGLPGPHDYQSVYRDGMDTDGLPSEGVYVGTTNGEVYASNNCGDHWQRLPGTLPPILSVTAAAL